MKSLMTTYDDIFLTNPRICNLIDDYNQSSKEKLQALGELVKGYIIYRGRNIPKTSPMSMLIHIPKAFSPTLLQEIIDELAGEKVPAVIQIANGCTYISLY